MKKILIAILVLAALPAFAQRRGFGSLKVSSGESQTDVETYSNWKISGDYLTTNVNTKRLMFNAQSDLLSFGGGYQYIVNPTTGSTATTTIWGSNSTGNNYFYLVEDMDGTPNYGGFGLISNIMRIWTGSSVNANYLQVGTTLISSVTYAHDMNGETMRPVQINDSGEFGYDSSTRRAKENIRKIGDTSWIYRLKPVRYASINTGVERDGLIAEEVAEVNDEYAFYDIIDGEKLPGGVYYERLITPLLAEIQRLHIEVEKLKREHGK